MNSKLLNRTQALASREEGKQRLANALKGWSLF
jgi:hypothetical protein